MSHQNISMQDAAEILKLLGHDIRLTMVKIMADHECCVCEFVELFDTSQPAISQHLRKLRDKQLIVEEKRGQWVYYQLNQDYEYYHFLRHIIDQLPIQAEKLEILNLTSAKNCC